MVAQQSIEWANAAILLYYYDITLWHYKCRLDGMSENGQRSFWINMCCYAELQSLLFVFDREKTPIAVFEKKNPQYHKFYSFDSLETMHVQYR